MNQYENNENEGYQGKYEYQGYGEYGQEMGEAENEQFVEIETKKGKKEKKQKEEMQPQCYLSVTNMTTWNYNVYYMTKKQKVVYFLLAFIVGGVVGYVFFGGLFKDEFYEPTVKTQIANLIVIGVTGTTAGKMFLPVRTQQILMKKKQALKLQFRDLLESLVTSLNAGNNVQDSFQSAHNDLALQYGESADIVYELEVILSGVMNNFAIENMLMDLGKRSGIEDIKSFSQVFEISYRRGGNIKDIVRNTQNILSDKMSIEADIETMMTANKSELNIMMVMPVILVGMMKGMSVEFAANFATVSGIAATVLGVIMFVVSYFIGRRIMDIKV